METSLIDEIEEKIASLSPQEQEALLSRFAQSMKGKPEQISDEELSEMAADPEIQSELAKISEDFLVTEFDGLSK